MSKLTDLKLKQQAITEWWAVRQMKRLIPDESSIKLTSISLSVMFLLLIVFAQAWAALDRLFHVRYGAP